MERNNVLWAFTIRKNKNKNHVLLFYLMVTHVNTTLLVNYGDA
jgi:hypothetical protein